MQRSRSFSARPTIRVVCISDTHLQCRGVRIPNGDILVHAGDLTGSGTLDELSAEVAWLESLPHPHKVIIAGNHDFCFQVHPEEAKARCGGLIYLQDEEAAVGGLRVYGSPWQPEFLGWAFGRERGEPLRQTWAAIPPGLDLLVTHGPPRTIGDRTFAQDHVGCDDLLEATRRTAPTYHVFGHVHEGYGMHPRGPTIHVNASLLDLHYHPVNPPIVLDVEVARPGRGA